MRLQFDLAKRADGARGLGQVAEDGQARRRSGLCFPALQVLGACQRAMAQHVRNVETFGKLQGAVLASITDMGTTS